MKLSEFSNDKELDEFIPAIAGGIARGAMAVGRAAVGGAKLAGRAGLGLAKLGDMGGALAPALAGRGDNARSLAGAAAQTPAEKTKEVADAKKEYQDKISELEAQIRELRTAQAQVR
jgi:hypothetical protein